MRGTFSIDPKSITPPPFLSALSQSGGRSSALAMSTLFTTLVLMPLPRPSIWEAGKGRGKGGGERVTKKKSLDRALSFRSLSPAKTHPRLQAWHLVAV